MMSLAGCTRSTGADGALPSSSTGTSVASTTPTAAPIPVPRSLPSPVVTAASPVVSAASPVLSAASPVVSAASPVVSATSPVVSAVSQSSVVVSSSTGLSPSGADRPAGSTGSTSAPTARPSPNPSPKPSATPGPHQVAANSDSPGPDHGPACAVDRRYSDESPTGLRDDVRTAWIAVKKQAAGKKVTLCLNDGKRSNAQQNALFAQYVKLYGVAAARLYVLKPDRSAHVKGYAVDVQPLKAYQWLQATKGELGWCRIYDNEPWHFEYSPVYRTGCPARLPMPVR